MIIDGKAIAETLLETLKTQTSLLKNKGLIPALAVILVGDDLGSASYVRQKEKTAERIGAQLRVMRYEVRGRKDSIQEQIKELNADTTIHGIIVQRPLPKQLQDKELLDSITPSKDVDGFVPNSPFTVPVASAVEKNLHHTYISMQQSNNVTIEQYMIWLTKQSSVVIGRGETAGKPIAEYLIHLGCNVSVVHSQTTNEEKQQHIKNADIIISCVGKKRVIQGAKQGATLISVGIWRDSEGKLHGDYEEDDIKDTAAYYTPTPGGVGPVNVACLMQNLVSACTNSSSSVH